ncbi:MAG: TIGR00730 family Rossman fold protein [Phocaeicola sp.]
MNDIKNVCVYCASSTQIDKSYVEAATELGQLFAKQGINLINGAGALGLMATVSDAVLQGGGTATGIIPRFMTEQGWHHTGLTNLIETDTMHERKKLMAELSDGIIALPGGCGTLEELLEIITWKQLALYLNPIVILNTNGFYDPLLEMLSRAVDEKFMREEHLEMWRVATTPTEAIELLRTMPKWDKSKRKIAAI